MRLKPNDTVNSRFLLKILPAFFLVSLFFLVTLSYFELNNAKKSHNQLVQEKTDNLARLLTEPVWQLSTKLSVNILKTTLDASDIICIKLEQDSDITPLIMEGECNDLSSEEVLEFNSPIIYLDLRNTSRSLGIVYLYTKNATQWSSITKQLITLTALSLTLFITLIIITSVAFRSTIITPLSRVSKSLKYYRQTGQRVPVNWDSTDELGQLISNYNRNLARQTEIEADLKEAHLKTENALSSLKEAQTNLIHSEKMASLGSLVAGIAHEINTPLGNSLTVATTVSDITRNISKDIESGALTKSALDSFIESITEASTILERNLETAAKQIRNFKNVAVDQTSEKRRKFDLKQVIDEIIYTLNPLIKHTPFDIEVSVPPDISLDSYPGPLGQIITNCFNNTLLHGFEGKSSGLIRIEANLINEKYLSLIISDNGNGMSPAECEKAFDPFFTTKLGYGGSGLGLNLVYNLTTTILGGTVDINSKINMGVTLNFKLPISAPGAHRTQGYV
ncbi:sensor histidine kinase [Neptunomonas japonica]|uniref:sensor histidine kinase n=1 Tax=Neptunomonas japonica TaxID=417574 RepID=UPI0004045405|nr:HAMP domain-containing sensor histidine kinase [Neptunomonas japonica]